MGYKLRFTLDEVAKIFNRSVDTVRFWITYKGFGRYGYKNNRTWYFEYDALKRFMEEDASGWMSKKELDQAMQRLEQKFQGGE